MTLSTSFRRVHELVARADQCLPTDSPYARACQLLRRHAELLLPAIDDVRETLPTDPLTCLKQASHETNSWPCKFLGSAVTDFAIDLACLVIDMDRQPAHLKRGAIDWAWLDEPQCLGSGRHGRVTYLWASDEWRVECSVCGRWWWGGSGIIDDHEA